MGKRGPAKEPTALKRLKGNPSKEQLNNDDLIVPCELPTAPAHLSVGAKREFNRLGLLLKKHGLVSLLDRNTLALCAAAWDNSVEATKEIRKYGHVLYTDKGYPFQNPHVAIYNKAVEQYNKYMAEFGLSPSSRARLPVTGEPTKKKEGPVDWSAGPPRLTVVDMKKKG